MRANDDGLNICAFEGGAPELSEYGDVACGSAGGVEARAKLPRSFPGLNHSPFPLGEGKSLRVLMLDRWALKSTGGKLPCGCGR